MIGQRQTRNLMVKKSRIVNTDCYPLTSGWLVFAVDLDGSLDTGSCNSVRGLLARFSEKERVDDISPFEAFIILPELSQAAGRMRLMSSLPLDRLIRFKHMPRSATERQPAGRRRSTTNGKRIDIYH
jgi:hypothetical protein